MNGKVRRVWGKIESCRYDKCTVGRFEDYLTVFPQIYLGEMRRGRERNEKK